MTIKYITTKVVPEGKNRNKIRTEVLPEGKIIRNIHMKEGNKE